jgi:DNA-directed RNA polymerase specialized sigma24 family protein
MLLNWAYKKLGDKAKAEDLAQEVLLQVFAAVKKNISENKQIEKPENMIWKIAHYVWCHYLRKDTNYKMFVPLDETQIDNDMDFAEKFADNEEEIQP